MRHGRTAYNKAGRIQGWGDILDATGQWQVEQTGRALRDLYVTSNAARQLVVASDLKRAQQGAHAFTDPPDSTCTSTDACVNGTSVTGKACRWTNCAPRFLTTSTCGCAAWWRMRHRAESAPTPAHGLGRAAWRSHRVGSDTDLFVFSHGALIENTIQEMYGIGERFPDFVSITSMRNAHWARLVDARIDEDDRWILVDYNHGPALADTPAWDDPGEARGRDE